MAFYNPYQKPGDDPMANMYRWMSDETRPDEHYSDPDNASPSILVPEMVSGDTDSTFGEMGIKADQDLNTGSLAERIRKYEEVMVELGAQFPERYSIKDLIINPNNFPEGKVVLKFVDRNRGEGKVIVENYKQMMRYLYWDSHLHELVEIIDPTEDSLKVNYERWKDKVVEYYRGTMDHELDHRDEVQFQGLTDTLRVEKFVESPLTDYNTTFRIVADAAGNIVYIQLQYAQIQKKQARDEDWKPVSPGEDLMEEARKRLHDSRSPIYIPEVGFHSNRAQGGDTIILRAKYADPDTYNSLDQEQKKVLEAHDIDPDMNGGVIDEAAKLAKEIAHRLRYVYPFIGVDLALGSDGELYFYEANPGPDLNRRAIGASDGETSAGLQKEMIRKVIDAIHAN